MNPNPRTRVGQPGGTSDSAVVMLVQFEPGDVEILRAQIAKVPPPPAERCPPGTTGHHRQSDTRNGREVRVAFLDEAGVLLEESGLCAEPVTFFDRPDLRRAGALSGASVRPSVDRRLIHVTVPAGATHLLFYETDEVGRTPTEPHQRAAPRGLALYDLRGARSVQQSSVPRVHPPMPARLPDARPFPFDRPFKPPEIGPRRRAGPAEVRNAHPDCGNYIHSVKLLKKCEVIGPGRCFNIVIMGDGFADVDLDMFNERVADLTDRLLKIPPWDCPQVQKHLGVHVVRAVSRHSGVDRCPYPPVRKETYFDIEGNWGDVGYAGFFGTPREDKIFDAGALIAPPDMVQLYLMLVNTALLGGRGDPATRIAYASIVPDPGTLASLVAHESAHAFACLADEYIGCDPDQTHYSFPNLATEDEVDSGSVCWKNLATTGELNLDGTFRAIHRQGNPVDPCSGEPILSPPELGQMLGLFWGCMYIDRPPRFLTDCDPWNNPNGARYYRPMARCMMRKLDWPFCRVCGSRIAAIIRGDPGKCKAG